MDSSIPREQDVLDLLEIYRPRVDELEKTVIGHTRVQLDASTCRYEECNLGNLITEAMIYFRVKLLESQNKFGFWTDASIALIQGGGIRASIDKNTDGNITMKDVLTVLPFEDKILLIQVHGKTIRNALEHSAKVYKTDSSGGFLQMHGLKVEYNMKNKNGQRVTSVQALCSECDIPQFEDLDDNKLYNVITSNFLYEGGDNHVFKEDNVEKPAEFSKLDYEIFKEFLETREVVYPELDERIKIYSSASTMLISLWALLSVFVLGRLV